MQEQVKHPNDPFSHVRQMLVWHIQDATPAFLLGGLLKGHPSGDKMLDECKARSVAMKLIMERFPEIEWRGPEAEEPVSHFSKHDASAPLNHAQFEK